MIAIPFAFFLAACNFAAAGYPGLMLTSIIAGIASIFLCPWWE